MNDFSVWLLSELEERGWTSAELAKRAGIYTATLSRILTTDRNAGPDVCNAIAQALGIPPEEVFRKAGLLPSLPTSDNNMVRETMELMKNLPLEEQEEVRDYARYRYQRKKKSN